MRSTIFTLFLFIISAATAHAAANKDNDNVHIQGIAEAQNYLNAVADCVAVVHEQEKFTAELKKRGWQVYEEYLDDGRKLKLLHTDHHKFFRDNVQLTFNLAKNTIAYPPLLNRNSCTVSATLPKSETKQSLETKFYDHLGFKFETRGHIVSKSPAKATITTNMVDITTDLGNTFFLTVYANLPEPYSQADLLTKTMASSASTTELILAMSACAAFVKSYTKDINSRIIDLGWNKILVGENRYNISSAKDKETIFVKGQIMLTVYTFENESACRFIAQLTSPDHGDQLKNEAIKTFKLKQPRDSNFSKRNPRISNELAKTMYENTEVSVRIKITQEENEKKFGTYVNIVIAPRI